MAFCTDVPWRMNVNSFYMNHVRLLKGGTIQVRPLQETLYVQGFVGCHFFSMTRSILKYMTYANESENLAKEMNSLWFCLQH
jgi:hypothetical protein